MLDIGDDRQTRRGSRERSAIDAQHEHLRFAPYGSNGPARGFIKLFLGTDYFLDQAHSSTTGSAQVNMGPRHLKTMAFPLPPLGEQHRIVARVDELMAVCDELEQSLATEQTERARLLEALLHDALEDALPERELEPSRER
jgi:restriction endonuclease S subunit